MFSLPPPRHISTLPDADLCKSCPHARCLEWCGHDDRAGTGGRAERSDDHRAL